MPSVWMWEEHLVLFSKKESKSCPHKLIISGETMWSYCYNSFISLIRRNTVQCIGQCMSHSGLVSNISLFPMWRHNRGRSCSLTLEQLTFVSLYTGVTLLMRWWKPSWCQCWIHHSDVFIHKPRIAPVIFNAAIVKLCSGALCRILDHMTMQVLTFIKNMAVTFIDYIYLTNKPLLPFLKCLFLCACVWSPYCTNTS